MKPFKFVRYVDGREMAEGVVIEREQSLEVAIKRAVSLCPQRLNTVLVYVPSQREWVGLTLEDIDVLECYLLSKNRHGNIAFAREIEAKLRSKNNG